MYAPQITADGYQSRALRAGRHDHLLGIGRH
jgi:hypothetical protein